jgi:hypothetical protein
LSNGFAVHGRTGRAVGLLEFHIASIPLVLILLSRREPVLDSVEHCELGCGIDCKKCVFLRDLLIKEQKKIGMGRKKTGAAAANKAA